MNINIIYLSSFTSNLIPE